MRSLKKKIYHTSSLEETAAIAREVIADVIAHRNQASKGACVIAMKGNLGAGKTTFVQGLARALGSRRSAQSPTFVIMRRIGFKKGPFKNLFHIDAYRLKSEDQLAMLDFENIVTDPNNIIVIEWAERVAKLLPKYAVRMEFKHGRTEGERTIIIKE